jgi:hypothetical protein
MAAYFDAYADRFGLRDRITFETGVERAERGRRRWEVTLDTGGTRRYDALMVANGHHWDPRWPEPAFPGSERFAGVQMHSHDYTGEDPAFFRDKRVVVLGMGNSAMDIAVEASFSAARRTSPRGGRLGDPQVPVRAPAATRSHPRGSRARAPACSQALLRARSATWSATGCRSPTTAARGAPDDLRRHPLAHRARRDRAEAEHRALDRAHRACSPTAARSRPTSSSTARATRSRSRSSSRADRRAGQRPAALPARVPPRLPDVFFVGCCSRSARSCRSPSCSPSGCATTSPAATRCRRRRAARRHRAERERMFTRYVASKRHTMQVDFDDYLPTWRRSARRGAERARRVGHALPVRRAPAREAA